MKRFSFFALSLLVASCLCAEGDDSDHSDPIQVVKPGDEIPMNTNDPEYWFMSDESLRYYLRRSGSTLQHHVVTVDRVTVQQAEGIITRLSFTAAPSYCMPENKSCEKDMSNAIVCLSKISELCGTTVTELEVECYPHT